MTKHKAGPTKPGNKADGDQHHKLIETVLELGEELPKPTMCDINKCKEDYCVKWHVDQEHKSIVDQRIDRLLSKLGINCHPERTLTMNEVMRLVQVKSGGQIKANNWGEMRYAYRVLGWTSNQIENQMYENMHLKMQDTVPEMMVKVWEEMDEARKKSRLNQLEYISRTHDYYEFTLFNVIEAMRGGRKLYSAYDKLAPDQILERQAVLIKGTAQKKGMQDMFGMIKLEWIMIRDAIKVK